MAKIFILILIVFSLSGCSPVVIDLLSKGSTGTLISNNKLTSIIIGATTPDEVLNLLGNPYKTTENKYSYIYMVLHPNYEDIKMQVLHVYFEKDKNVVNKTTFIEEIQYWDRYIKPEVLFDKVSQLKTNESNINDVKDEIGPASSIIFYVDGHIIAQSLVYDTNEPIFDKLQNLSFVLSSVHKDNNASYQLLFTNNLLTASTTVQNNFLGQTLSK